MADLYDCNSVWARFFANVKLKKQGLLSIFTVMTGVLGSCAKP